MVKKIDPKVAEKVMFKAGFKPLEAYKNSDKPWKCKCLKCKNVSSPYYYHVKNGKRCKYCRKKAVTPNNAVKVMLKAGYKPMQPYKNSITKWKSIHMECGEIVYPKYKTIRRGTGGCATCGLKKLGLATRISEKEAVSLMLKAKLKPLEPYKGAGIRWKCRCLGCGNIVKPRYNTVKQRGVACKTCGTIRRGVKRRTPEGTAIEIMLKANLKPLEPYTNTKTNWKCKCLKCRTIVYPSLGTIVSGDGGCSTCAPFGISMTKPSYLYLITNVGLNAHKVGIGNHKKRKDRLSKFTAQDWETHKVWQMKTGAKALKIERAVFKIIRKDLKLPVFLNNKQMPKTEGASETINADQITLLELEKIIKKVIKG